MIISFVGAGKAALSLSKYLKKNGHTIKYISDTDSKKCEIFKNQLGCKISTLETIAHESDMVFLTVNDNAIYEVWTEIKKYIKNDVIVLHCSGAKEGIYGEQNLYSLHPASPLTGNDQLESICFGLENFGEKTPFIETFIKEMGNKVFLIPKEKKHEYHLANVMVSNLVLSLIEKGITQLKSCGLNETESIKLLMPLAEQNLLNIKTNGILESVTGPVARGDFNTCIGHLDVLDNEDKGLYKILSKNILKILGVVPPDLFL